MNERLRSLFPLTSHVAYLNHAAVSPPPVSTLEAVNAQLSDVASNGSRNYRSWVAVKERARRLYRSFVEGSRGEFSVAKETYVKGRTGWFSCRSACYLAAGRAVVTQDTGWSKHLPEGVGLLAFDDAEGAAEALRRVESDPARHSRAARAVAEEHFDSGRVLASLLAEAGV